MKTTKIIFFALVSCVLQVITRVDCDSGDLVDSWKKINTNYANDIQESNKIYYKVKEEQSALAELRIIVERHLRTKNAERLVNAIGSGNNSIPTNHLYELAEELILGYDKELVESIFATALDEVMLTSDLNGLPIKLWNIYLPNNKKLFEVMLRAQLQLFNRFARKRHTDDIEFLNNFANTLQKIKQDPLYKSIDLSLKLKVHNIVEQLPDNIKYLYFMPYFCLLNSKYSTYIYTAIETKVDPLSRYIWLWRDTRSMDDTGYIKAEVGDLSESNNNNTSKLNVVLKGWDSTDTPVNYIWSVDFLDNDRVVFSQNDYLMCAVENHDNDRRNVGGRKMGEVSTTSPECQWRLGQCNFK